MLKFFVLNVIICLIIFLSACENKPTQKYIKAPINPNGDSELALVMRNMFDEVFDLKKKLREGGDIDSIALYHESLYAQATEDGLEKSKAYQLYGDHFLKSYDLFLKSKGEDQIDLYNSMIQNCMNCHQSLCPGPMVKIKKLFLKN